jgi:endogenous inhibitor of DNA gyrase (YacG/DUF329 family)
MTRLASRQRPCPICRKPRTAEHAPFCSEGCKDRDLARWFNDAYAVPGEPVDPNSLGLELRGDDEQSD